MILHGIGASAGIGIGHAVCLREQNLDYTGVVFSGKEEEKKRLQTAVDTFCFRTQAMADDLQQRIGEKESEILTGQIMMLNDPFMISQMQEAIDGGSVAEAAVDHVCTLYADMFAGMEDELMRQRSADVQDIRTRMLGILLGEEAVDLSTLPAGSVLIAHDLTPSMTVGLKREKIAAILTETGGKTSHSAILARALEVPAVLSIPDVLSAIADGAVVIADGSAGEIIVDPDFCTINAYEEKRKAFLEERAQLSLYRDRKTADADGNPYALYANIGTPAEAEAAQAAGAEGIGLFRTEFLFMDRSTMPSEEEQTAAYLEVSEQMAGKEVIIRTLDIGGDKAVPYLQMGAEDNPFLGYRAIRYCLDHSEIFQIQLRALLRAGAKYRNIKIMLPLINSVEEVRAAKALLAACKKQLADEGIAFDDGMQVGVMIETPAAVMIADWLAREVDFFSIGTNDLTQYVMAVDRGNARVEKLYTAFHPAVLRSIRSVIQAAKRAGIPVGMCGEAAADPGLIPLLLSFGLDEFSVSASSVLQTRKLIAGWHAADAAAVTEKAMNLSTAEETERYLQAVHQKEEQH